jgi:invasion protein IalB
LKIAKQFACLVVACLVVAGIIGWSCSSSAQQPPTKSKAAPGAAQATPQPAPPPQADSAPQPGWIARCTSPSRDAPLECAAEETAVLTKTGQVVVLVNIRVPSDTHVPVALVQLPLGLSLPAGAKLQIDDGKPVDLQIQTCENRGCYGSTPLAPELLAAMRSGKQLKVMFQNMNKEGITIPMPLEDFAAAYDKIK